MGPGGGAGVNPYATTYLGLSEEQNSKLQATREKHFKEISPLQEKLFSKRQELRLLWANPNPDAAQVTAKQKEIAQLQAQIQEMTTKHQLEARSILTPEQQQKLAAMTRPWARGRLGQRTHEKGMVRTKGAGITRPPIPEKEVMDHEEDIGDTNDGGGAGPCGINCNGRALGWPFLRDGACCR